MTPPPPRSTLFPYTTLFRSLRHPSYQPTLARQTARHGRKRRSEEHTSELQSPDHLVCRLLLEKKKKTQLTPAGVIALDVVNAAGRFLDRMRDVRDLFLLVNV